MCEDHFKLYVSVHAWPGSPVLEHQYQNQEQKGPAEMLFLEGVKEQTPHTQTAGVLLSELCGELSYILHMCVVPKPAAQKQTGYPSRELSPRHRRSLVTPFLLEEFYCFFCIRRARRILKDQECWCEPLTSWRCFMSLRDRTNRLKEWIWMS